MTIDPNFTSQDPGRSELRLNSWLAHIKQWPSVLRRTLVLAGAIIACLLLVCIVSAPLDLYTQCLFAALCFGSALLIKRVPGRFPILALIVLSLVASLRYLYWRLTDTLGFEGWLDMLFGYGLVLAEIYALVVLRADRLAAAPSSGIAERQPE